MLASGELGPISRAGSGLIGVTFLTSYRLAELLAAPRLAAVGRRPVSTPVVAAAVRRVLATDPGRLFAPVAGHPATEEALVGAHRDLSDLDDPALTRLAENSERAREVVRIHRLVKERLAPQWYDEHDLMPRRERGRSRRFTTGRGAGHDRDSSPAAHHRSDRAAVPPRWRSTTSWL